MTTKCLLPMQFQLKETEFPLRVEAIKGTIDTKLTSFSILVTSPVKIECSNLVEGANYNILIIQDEVGHEVTLGSAFVILSGTINKLPSGKSLLRGVYIDGCIYCDII
jgi:hypothetical protein